MKEKLWNLLRDKTCTRCSLWENAQCVCLIGDGPYPTEVMFIGEAPGWREEDVKKPFSGRAGELLDHILESIKLDRIKIYITNAVHCRPPENRTPKKKEIEACKYYLDQEIDYVKPKKIVLLGRAAVISVLEDKDSTIEELRNKIFSYKGAKVFVTYHPAAALRRPFLTKVIRTDLRNYLLAPKEGNGEKPVIYKDINSKEDFELFKKGFAFDLETEGLNFKTDSILCSSFSPKSRESYFTSEILKYKDRIARFLNDEKILKIAHNLKFDLKFSLSENLISEKHLPRNKFFCTMIASNVLDENYLQKDLEHLATMNTSMTPWKSEDDFLSPNKLRLRNLKDADAHRRLYNIFSKRLEKENLWNPFKIDMNMMKVLVSAEYYGIKVDTKELNDLDIHLTGEIEKLGRKISVNPGSNPQMTEYFRKYGIKSPKETEKGAPSWGKDILETLSNKLEGRRKEIVDQIIKYKQLFGIKSKFIDNLRVFIDNEDRVHPTFNQVKAFDEEGEEGGTFTGRLSCKNPNLQQVTRDREDLPREINPRRLFVPIHPGGFILSADYNQIEVRMAAHLANDENLIGLLKKGGDIHQLVAAEVLKKPPDKVTKDERKQIKKVVFGILYLISAWGLANKLKIDEDLAARYIRWFFRAFPAQEEYQSNSESEIIENQQIANIFGRLRRLPGATNRTGQGRAMIRQGVNFPNQGSSVDIVKIAMSCIFCDIIEGGYKSRIFANVHDEIALSGYPGEEDAMIKIFRKRMLDPGLEEFGVKLKVPLAIKLGIGPNWLETKEVN